MTQCLNKFSHNIKTLQPSPMTHKAYFTKGSTDCWQLKNLQTLLCSVWFSFEVIHEAQITSS